ncbi:MAG TPA: DUF4337 family protein [Candidatus Cybelea sp.]|nr:DUF4337 family protein [Candidatus Cybelea sp.]
MKTRSIETVSNSRLVSLATAIIAVLAALGTLFAHHRSIAALSSKNQAILMQARASDTYNAYEAKQIRFNIYRALLATGLVNSAETRGRLESAAESESASMPAVLEKAKALEREAEKDDVQSETILKSYETLQFATTAFEISIVLVSISALAGARLFLPLGCALSAFGVALLITGLIQNG